MVILPTEKAGSFDIYKNRKSGTSQGDKVFIAKNAFDKQHKRPNNGQLLEVTRVTKQGQIKLRDIASKAIIELDEDFGHIAHAHCVTSRSSQGNTVDEVFILQPASTFGATDGEQFYVSVLRAKDKATVYTDDKETLLHHALEIGDRQSALELMKKQKVHEDNVVIMKR